MAPNSISEAGPSGCVVQTKKTEAGVIERPSEGHEEARLWTFKDIKWRNTIVLTLLHFATIYSFFDLPRYGLTYLLQFIILLGAAFGVTAGSHRYFTHRSYRANSKLRYFLIFLQTLSAQEDILKWVRDHRVHHKFTDTNADPHNSKRGFFFSHVGWLLIKKHPDVKKFGSKVDMSDLENDKALLFHRKIYMASSIFIAFIAPILGSHWLWGEDLIASTNFNIARYVLGLHVNWSINSVAHIWGMRPYDKNNSSTDSYLFGFLAFGEGWHNFHHAFPWDYKTGEYDNYWFNFSLIFIDLFAWLGWATDLKTTTDDMIKKRAIRTGDMSHPYAIEAKKKDCFVGNNNNNEGSDRDLDHFWGWDDPDMIAEDKQVKILHRQFE